MGLVSSSVAQPAASEEFIARTWTTAEGLPDNSVTAVLQTSDGFLWVGTQRGLVKFDGNSFLPVRLDYSINEDLHITAMTEDRLGRIWIGTDLRGLFCYSNGVVTRIAPDSIPVSITTLALGEQNDLWIGTHEGFGLWNGRALRWFTPEDGIPREPVSSICVARSGKVWVTAHSGVYLYQDQKLGKYHFTTQSLGQNPQFLGIFEDQRSELWGFGDTYLIRLGDGRRFNYFRNGQISSAIAIIWSFYEARDGRLWIGTSGKGLFLFTGEGFRPVVFKNGNVPNDVRCIYQDRERNIWLGTDGGGLVQLRQENWRRLGELDGLPEARASGIVQNAGDQIVISYLDDGAFAGEGEHFLPYGPVELADLQHLTQTLCVATNGDTWFGSPSVGLLCLHDNRVIRFEDDSALAGDAVTRLYAAPDGRVFAGTSSGQIYLCTQNALRPLGSVLAPVSALFGTTDNQLLIGTSVGTLWQLRDGVFSPVVNVPESSLGAVTGLCQDSSDRVWMGTFSTGLYCLHNHNVTHWPEIEDHPGLRIYAMINDQDDNLWLATSRGIALLETSDLNQALASGVLSALRFTDHLNISDSPGLGGPHALRSRDGTLWFILQGSVIQVDPRAWRPPRSPPEIFLTAVNVNGSRLYASGLQKASASGGPLSPARFSSFVGDLNFNFTSPCLTDPEQTRFRYQLQGFDPDWVDADSLHRQAHYGFVPPGKYTFRVIAANPQGTWNKNGITFSFVVPQPVWRRPWAIASTLLFLTGLLVWLVRYVSHRRLLARLSKLERSEEMARERIRIAQDMHDEIGSKLARISFLSESVKAELKGVYDQTDVVDSLARTSRELLQSLDRMVWAVNPRNDSLENLASYLNRYASEYFQSTSIECQLAIPNNLPAIPLSAEIRHNLFLAFEETLTNAIKHSGATRVTVDLTFVNGLLQISVSDNGSGFDISETISDSDQHHDRLGLSGLHRRLESIGGRCEISSRPGQGTSVKLILQLHYEHAQ